MAGGVSTPTPRLRLEQQAAGTNLSTWGDPHLNQALARIEESICGQSYLTVSGAVTLSSANYNGDQSHYGVLNVTGGTGGTITVPSVEKTYIVLNAATNVVTLTTGAGLTSALQPNDYGLVACDGTNVVSILTLGTVKQLIAGAVVAGSNLPALGPAGSFLKDLDGSSAGWALLQQSDVNGLVARLIADEAVISATTSSLSATVTAVQNLQDNVAGLTLSLARTDAARIGYANGFDDPFEDATGIDQAATNAVFAANGLIKNLPSGALWTPANLAGFPIATWFDASALATLNIANGVQQWNGVLGTETWSSAQISASCTPPSYHVGTYPAVTLNGSEQMLLSNPAALPTTNMSVAAQVNIVGTSGTYPASLLYVGRSAALANAFTLSQASGTSVSFGCYGNSGSLNSTATSGTFSAGCVYGSINSAGTVATLNANGAATVTGSTSTSASTGAAPSTGVLGYYVGYSSQPNVSVNETLVFTRPLTTAERQQVEGYLAWKWGTQASLAAGHPYLSAAPRVTAATATLQSLAPVTLTQGTPSAGYLYAFAKLGSGAAINTDLVGALSRDGATFSTGAFTPLFTGADGHTLYKAGPIDLTGQPTGVTPKYRLTMTSTAEIDVAGVILREA